MLQKTRNMIKHDKTWSINPRLSRFEASSRPGSLQLLQVDLLLDPRKSWPPFCTSDHIKDTLPWSNNFTRFPMHTRLTIYMTSSTSVFLMFFSVVRERTVTVFQAFRSRRVLSSENSSLSHCGPKRRSQPSPVNAQQTPNWQRSHTVGNQVGCEMEVLVSRRFVESRFLVG